MTAIAAIATVRTPTDARADLANVATDFEALFIAQILKSAHAAALAEDPLKSDGEDSFRALQDETTAKAIATAAPLGVARELARATAARQTP
jgi:Rod binding domain-containing protein